VGRKRGRKKRTGSRKVERFLSVLEKNDFNWNARERVQGARMLKGKKGKKKERARNGLPQENQKPHSHHFFGKKRTRFLLGEGKVFPKGETIFRVREEGGSTSPGT